MSGSDKERRDFMKNLPSRPFNRHLTMALTLLVIPLDLSAFAWVLREIFMANKTNVIFRGLAGVICLGLLSACADRMGTFKANHTSCEQYNDWARKNNQPLRCGATIDGKNVVKSEAGNVLENVDANADTQNSPADTTKYDADATKPGATSKIVNPSEQKLNRPYTRIEWTRDFERLIGTPSKGAAELVKGITVNPGLAENQKDVNFDFKAVVKFNGQFMYLTSGDERQVIRFDKDVVLPLKILVKKSLTDKDAKEEVLSNDLIATATCLADESPCTRFGLVLDFKTVQNRTKAIFEIVTTRDAAVVKGTGVVRSNLGDQLRSFEEGQNQFAQLEKAPGNLPVTMDDSKQPADQDLFKGAQDAAKVVTEKRATAEAAYKAADEAHKTNDAAKADEQAKLAEAALKSADESNKIVADWMGQAKAKMTDSAKQAEADRVIADSAKQLEEIKGFAEGARINANYSKMSAEANERVKASQNAAQDATGKQKAEINAMPVTEVAPVAAPAEEVQATTVEEQPL